MTALLAAFFSAVFAAASTLLIKCFASRTDSTVVTAVQTFVMFPFSVLVCIFAGSFRTLPSTDLRSILFMTVSGVATGLTWLFYFRALKEGDADKVMPIEKANIFLAILIAVFFFHETRFFAVKMTGAAIVFLGLVFLLIGSLKASKGGACSCRWLKYALLSSFFAGVNTIFSKLALAGMDSNFGTMLNTAVALIIVLLLIAGEKKLTLFRTSPQKEMLVVAASGVSTALNWLLYYYAVKYAPMSAAVPLNKLSVPMVILFSRYVLGSRIRKEQGIGLAGIVAGMMVVAVVA